MRATQVMKAAKEVAAQLTLELQFALTPLRLAAQTTSRTPGPQLLALPQDTLADWVNLVRREHAHSEGHETTRKGITQCYCRRLPASCAATHRGRIVICKQVLPVSLIFACPRRKCACQYACKAESAGRESGATSLHVRTGAL